MKESEEMPPPPPPQEKGETRKGGRATRGKRLSYDILNDGGTDPSQEQSEMDEDYLDGGELDENNQLRIYRKERTGKRGRGGGIAPERTKNSWGPPAVPRDHRLMGDTGGMFDSMAPQNSNKKEEYVYKIDSVLYRKTMTHVEWREYLSAPKYHTSEIKRGSVWVVPDDIWYDNSEGARSKLVTRYLVKWKDLSYLHVSWELPADLTNQAICGVAVIGNEKGYAKRRAEDLLNQVDAIVHQGQKLFADLCVGEYFPQ